jgi:hypothetical protein
MSIVKLRFPADDFPSEGWTEASSRTNRSKIVSIEFSYDDGEGRHPIIQDGLRSMIDGSFDYGNSDYEYQPHTISGYMDGWLAGCPNLEEVIFDNSRFDEFFGQRKELYINEYLNFFGFCNFSFADDEGLKKFDAGFKIPDFSIDMVYDTEKVLLIEDTLFKQNTNRVRIQKDPKGGYSSEINYDLTNAVLTFTHINNMTDPAYKEIANVANTCFLSNNGQRSVMADWSGTTKNYAWAMKNMTFFFYEIASENASDNTLNSKMTDHEKDISALGFGQFPNRCCISMFRGCGKSLGSGKIEGATKTSIERVIDESIRKNFTSIFGFYLKKDTTLGTNPYTPDDWDAEARFAE